MRVLLDAFIDFVSYDAERDFYAKVFPELLNREDDSMAKIRLMKRRDITEMHEIEKQVYDFPWSVGTFHDCMTAGYHCWVYDRMGIVHAYGILSVGAGESHIMNICVAPDFQGRGYGQKMLRHLIQEAQRHRATTILLEVRPSNETAIRLYERMGFNEIGERKDYYPALNGRENALMFAMDLAFTLES